MNKNRLAMEDGLLRLNAKLQALAELIGKDIEVNKQILFGLHCILSDLADEVNGLAELNSLPEGEMDTGGQA